MISVACLSDRVHNYTNYSVGHLFVISALKPSRDKCLGEDKTLFQIVTSAHTTSYSSLWPPNMAATDYHPAHTSAFTLTWLLISCTCWHSLQHTIKGLLVFIASSEVNSQFLHLTSPSLWFMRCSFWFWFCLCFWTLPFWYGLWCSVWASPDLCRLFRFCLCLMIWICLPACF